MNTQHITRLLSAGLVLAVLAVGAALGWPLWLWFLLASLIAAALLIDMRVSRAEASRPTAQDLDESTPEPPTEVPYQETSIVVVPVQSAVDDCPFLFSAVVWWRPAGRFALSTHGNPAALAATSVLQRVQNMTLTEDPGRCTFLERSLEGLLGTPSLDDSGLVVAFATDVRLVLRPRDQRHLEELDGLRKAMGSWESRRQHERNLREYLGEDVLRSPGNAVVWWMARHDDEIERAVDMIAPLTVLSAAANDEEIPEEYRDLFRDRGKPVEGEPMSGFDHPEPGDGQAPSGHGPIRSAAGQEQPPTDSLAAWLDGEGFTDGSDETRVFLDRLARMSDAAGRPEAAENIRRHMRRADHEGGRTPADPFEEAATEDPPPPGPASSPPPPYGGDAAGHPTDAAEPSSTGSRQTTREGMASEANGTTRQFDPGAWARGDTGPEWPGGER
ncbi:MULTISPECIES: hypothetical protein [Streptomyces]|uniref:hypothetical protein n=1 Tax=Streptomyces TaxID=1883 RepID=UPI0006925B2E|nr:MULTISPECIES: hypothetical protein [Streptomyces]ONI51071.1 hypothetical protein STIB_48760 [Streptomyces sp. IB2014 011-1]RDV48915.1 hypothetical protein DDV98_26315 [Streptomyces sp. IB2014 011-12]